MLAQGLYRARQFSNAFRAGLTAADEELVRRFLKVEQQRLFYAMRPLAQRHHLDVGADLLANGWDRPDLVQAALLHDVGKGLTHEHEGTHVELGYQLCKKFNESDQVLNAIKAHHDEEPHRYPETFLVTAADAISGSRPGQ